MLPKYRMPSLCSRLFLLRTPADVLLTARPSQMLVSIRLIIPEMRAAAAASLHQVCSQLVPELSILNRVSRLMLLKEQNPAKGNTLPTGRALQIVLSH